MPLIRTIDMEDGRLLIWELAETAGTLAGRYPKVLNDPGFQRITSQKRQQEWLAIRALLYAANCGPDQLSYTEHGRPVIDHPIYQGISISHSDRFAGLLLHRSPHAGLDIERTDRNFVRVEHKYLSAEERRLALSVPNGHALFWCIKEAVYKAAGIAGVHFADQIRILPNHEGTLSARLLTGTGPHYRLVHFGIDQQLVVYAVLF